MIHSTKSPASQNYGIMKIVGYLYIGFALLLLIGGVWVGLALVRADFYADYRRGMHLVVGVGAFLISALLALGFYVQGSMAAAVADIDTTTRGNGMAIEATRRFSERAARSSQQAARSSDALLHAHTALQQASDDARASSPGSLPPASAESLLDSFAPADSADVDAPLTAARTQAPAEPPHSAVDNVVQSLFARSRRPWREPAADAAGSTAPAAAQPDASSAPINEAEVRG
jgi:hypothetical protein